MDSLSKYVLYEIVKYISFTDYFDLILVNKAFNSLKGDENIYKTLLRKLVDVQLEEAQKKSIEESSTNIMNPNLLKDPSSDSLFCLINIQFIVLTC